MHLVCQAGISLHVEHCQVQSDKYNETEEVEVLLPPLCSLLKANIQLLDDGNRAGHLLILQCVSFLIVQCFDALVLFIAITRLGTCHTQYQVQVELKAAAD